MSGSSGSGSQAAVMADGITEIRAVGQSINNFLSTAQVVVLDVLRGSAPRTRRLLLGEPEGLHTSYATAVADDIASTPAVQTEQRLLGDLSALLPARLRATVPEVIGPVDMAGRAGLVVTAVPGLEPERRRVQPGSLRDRLQAVHHWQAALWHETASASGPVDLGAASADVLLAHYAGSAQLAPTLGAVHRARQRLGSRDVPRTVVHGCLCTRHVKVAAGDVVGVDDWGRGSVSADPLRDLGGYALALAGERLPEIVVGRTAAAQSLRDYVVAGLRKVELPDRCWRDVVVLSQLERAMDELALGRVGGLELLARTVQALPGERRYDETRTR